MTPHLPVTTSICIKGAQPPPSWQAWLLSKPHSWRIYDTLSHSLKHLSSTLFSISSVVFFSFLHPQCILYIMTSHLSRSTSAVSIFKSWRLSLPLPSLQGSLFPVCREETRIPAPSSQRQEQTGVPQRRHCGGWGNPTLAVDSDCSAKCRI